MATTPSEQTPLMLSVSDHKDQDIILNWPYIPLFELDANLKIQLDDLKKRYTKYRGRRRMWNKRNSKAKMAERFIVGMIMIATAVLSVIAGVKVSPTISYIAAGLAAFATLQDPLKKLIITDWTVSKYRKYVKKCSIVRKGLVNLYFKSLTHKDNSRIEDDERVMFQRVFNEVYEKLLNLRTANTVDEVDDIDLDEPDLD